MCRAAVAISPSSPNPILGIAVDQKVISATKRERAATFQSPLEKTERGEGRVAALVSSGFEKMLITNE
jgi:hypothetical protein